MVLFFYLFQGSFLQKASNDTLISDTTSSTITHLLFHLARDRELSTKLQQELDKLPRLHDRDLISIELLDAVIFETLRLHPATPAGLSRTTSENGLMVNDTYIPYDVVVTVPLYTLFRGLNTHHFPD